MNDADSMQLASGIAAFEAKEFRRAWQMLEPLSDQGIEEAQYRCAVMVQNGLGVIARPKEAAALMLQAAEKDYPLAQHSMGVMNLFGEGVEQNTEQAIFWLERAGENGLAGSWSTLGLIYKEGRGVEPDEEKANACYAKAGFDPSEFA